MNISLLIPKGKHKKKSVELEIAAAKNIRSKETRDSITKGLKKILENYSDGKAFYWVNDKLEIFDYEGVDSIYHCGKDILVPDIQKRKYGFVVMDLSECSLYELIGKKTKLLWHDTSNVPGKMKKGGQSAERFSRERQNKINLWYKKIANKMKEYWLDIGGKN